MALDDMKPVAKRAVKALVDGVLPGTYFTLNGLSDELKEAGWEENPAGLAQSTVRRIKGAVERGGRENPLPIQFAKMIRYPVLNNGRMEEEPGISYPWRDTNGNSIVYRRTEGRCPDDW